MKARNSPGEMDSANQTPPLEDVSVWGGEIPCFRCGVCCSQQVQLSLTEVRRISDRLGLTWSEFVQRYTDPAWPGENSLLLRLQEGVCVFLTRASGSREAKCFIQPFKPAACCAWMAGLTRRQCREGLAHYWGLKVSPSGKLDKNTMEQFRKLLDSLDIRWRDYASLRI